MLHIIECTDSYIGQGISAADTQGVKVTYLSLVFYAATTRSKENLPEQSALRTRNFVKIS